MLLLFERSSVIQTLRPIFESQATSWITFKDSNKNLLPLCESCSVIQVLLSLFESSSLSQILFHFWIMLIYSNSSPFWVSQYSNTKLLYLNHVQWFRCYLLNLNQINVFIFYPYYLNHVQCMKCILSIYLFYFLTHVQLLQFHVSFLSHIQRLQYPSHYLNQVKILLSVFESSSVNDIQICSSLKIAETLLNAVLMAIWSTLISLVPSLIWPVLNNSNASTYLHFNCSKMSLYIVLKSLMLSFQQYSAPEISTVFCYHSVLLETW